MASGGGSSLVQGSSVLELECGLCIKKGKHSKAKTFCHECEAYLCGSCADTHGRFPALRNHKTVSTEDMMKICGLCNADGKKNEAILFCKDCDSWICDDCKESHGNFRDLRYHTIVSRNSIFHSDSTAPTDISVDLVSYQRNLQKEIHIPTLAVRLNHRTLTEIKNHIHQRNQATMMLHRAPLLYLPLILKLSSVILVVL